MNSPATDLFRERLNEKLSDSLSALLPDGTPRRVFGALQLRGKVAAVVGMRRAGKTMFLHQIQRERLQGGVAREQMPYINFEDERMAGLTAEHPSPAGRGVLSAVPGAEGPPERHLVLR